MAFCIMNVDKQKRAATYGLQIEANRAEGDNAKRDFDRSDIDWTRTRDNIFLRKEANWGKHITKRIKEVGVKEKKDSVVMITGVYTASPEWFETHTKEEALAYFKDCLAYHDKTYGHAFNAVIHMDETTPHMQVASVPLIEDEKGWHLSAKIIMGGRDDYRRRQDEFYEQVGKAHDMERGERRDPAEKKLHTTKREWQAAEVERRIKEARKTYLTELQGLASQVQNARKEVKQKNEELKAASQKLLSTMKELKTLQPILEKIDEKDVVSDKLLLGLLDWADMLAYDDRKGSITLTDEERDVVNGILKYGDFMHDKLHELSSETHEMLDIIDDFGEH